MRGEEKCRRRDVCQSFWAGKYNMTKRFEKSGIELVENRVLNIDLQLVVLLAYLCNRRGGQGVHEGLEENEFPPRASSTVTQAAQTEDNATVHTPSGTEGAGEVGL